MFGKVLVILLIMNVFTWKAAMYPHIIMIFPYIKCQNYNLYQKFKNPPYLLTLSLYRIDDNNLPRFSDTKL